MLALGGYINLLIAAGHLIGLIWAEQMFAITGIGREMAELSQVHASLPYLMTVFVAVFFTLFGLYGLSASGKFRPLPFLKVGIFAIAGIYLLRGVGELIFDMAMQDANLIAETTYSLIAVAIGLLFLIGGWQKWRVSPAIN
ncbi:MAG: hypothetical protein AAF399_18780 [Bacteroidota bacterium]